MVWVCVEEGWCRVEKSVGVWSEGQEEARMTKEDVENESGEEGCLDSSEMESGHWRDCCYGDNTGSKLDWWWR